MECKVNQLALLDNVTCDLGGKQTLFLQQGK